MTTTITRVEIPALNGDTIVLELGSHHMHPYVSLQIWTTVGQPDGEPELVGSARVDGEGSTLLADSLRSVWAHWPNPNPPHPHMDTRPRRVPDDVAVRTYAEVFGERFGAVGRAKVPTTAADHDRAMAAIDSAVNSLAGLEPMQDKALTTAELAQVTCPQCEEPRKLPELGVCGSCANLAGTRCPQWSPAPISVQCERPHHLAGQLPEGWLSATPFPADMHVSYTANLAWTEVGRPVQMPTTAPGEPRGTHAQAPECEGVCEPVPDQPGQFYNMPKMAAHTPTQPAPPEIGAGLALTDAGPTEQMVTDWAEHNDHADGYDPADV